MKSFSLGHKKKIPSDNEIIGKEIFIKNFHALDKAFNTTNRIKSALKIYCGGRTYASLKKLKNAKEEIKELDNETSKLSLSRIPADIINESILDLFSRVDDSQFETSIKYHDNKKVNNEFFELYDYLRERREKNIFEKTKCFEDIKGSYYKKGLIINDSFINKLKNIYNSSPIDTKDGTQYGNLYLFNFYKYKDETHPEKKFTDKNIFNKTINETNESKDTKNSNEIKYGKLKQVKYMEKVYRINEKNKNFIEEVKKEFIRSKGVEWSSLSLPKRVSLLSNFKEYVAKKKSQLKNSNLSSTLSLIEKNKLQKEMNEDIIEINKLKDTIANIDNIDIDKTYKPIKPKSRSIKPYSSYNYMSKKYLKNPNIIDNSSLDKSSSDFFKRDAIFGKNSNENLLDSMSTSFGATSNRTVFFRRIGSGDKKKIIKKNILKFTRYNDLKNKSNSFNKSKLNRSTFHSRPISKISLISDIRKNKRKNTKNLLKINTRELTVDDVYEMMKKMNQKNKEETMEKIKDYFLLIGINFEKVKKLCSKKDLYTFFDKLRSTIINYDINKEIKGLNYSINRHLDGKMAEIVSSIEKYDKKLDEFKNLFYLTLLREQS